MASFLTGSIELVGDILSERFGNRSKLFNDPITTLQICQHIIKVGIEKSEYLHPKRQKALKIGRDIFQANNLYSGGQRNNARSQVEKIIEAIANIGPTIEWPDTVKKAYTKFAKSFPTAFVKNELPKPLNIIDSFDAILEEGKDTPHIFALKNVLLDLRVAVEARNLTEIEGAFYSVIDYYYLPKQESSLVST
jgi:hypothetical protein